MTPNFLLSVASGSVLVKRPINSQRSSRVPQIRCESCATNRRGIGSRIYHVFRSCYRSSPGHIPDRQCCRNRSKDRQGGSRSTWVAEQFIRQSQTRHSQPEEMACGEPGDLCKSCLPRYGQDLYVTRLVGCALVTSYRTQLLMPPWGKF